MYDDEEFIPISALQHYLFCPRQCALIHVDGLWAENRLTVEGGVIHEHADTPGRRKIGARSRPADVKDGVHVVRAMPLVSHRMGLVGKADTVEFPDEGDGEGIGSPVPVEYKRGRPKRIDADRVQLCAQAMCLEEMLGVGVPRGELFYHAVRRRERVEMDDGLRHTTEDVVRSVRDLVNRNVVPRASRQRKCANCSLLNLCVPDGTGPDRSPRRYLSRSLAASLRDDGGAHTPIPSS